MCPNVPSKTIPALGLAALVAAIGIGSAPAQAKTTTWVHNGSSLELNTEGRSRQFYYMEPRPGLVDVGIRPGSLLFTGTSDGKRYFGTAYLFHPRCGPTPYQVSGPILDNHRRVVLKGEAPRFSADCHVQGYFTDRLEFSLMEGSDTGTTGFGPTGHKPRTEPTAHSEYTSLDAGCKMLWRAADEHPLPPLPDSFKSICPGREGMRVILEGGDGRSWIGLLRRGAKYDEGTRLYANWGGFPEVTGKHLEWRYIGPKLAALIVRMEWTDQSNAGGTNDISGLVIWRVDASKADQACLVGQTTSNEEARAVADDLNKRCLEN